MKEFNKKIILNFTSLVRGKMTENSAASEDYSDLIDEELVLKYKSGELSKHELWTEMCDRYLGLIKDEYYKQYENEYSGLNVGKEDLFSAIFTVAMEREIFKSWKREKMSVKNYFVIHFNDWLLKDYFKSNKSVKEWIEHKVVSEDDIDEVVERPSEQKEMTGGSDVVSNKQIWELEEEALDFLNEVLTDSNSIFADTRHKGRRQVIQILKDNYEKVGEIGVKKDGEKAQEVNMTGNSFTMRKIRALDDLFEELEKRDYPLEIVVYFGEILNYRIDTLAARVKDIRESS